MRFACCQFFLKLNKNRTQHNFKYRTKYFIKSNENLCPANNPAWYFFWIDKVDNLWNFKYTEMVLKLIHLITFTFLLVSPASLSHASSASDCRSTCHHTASSCDALCEEELQTCTRSVRQMIQMYYCTACAIACAQCCNDHRVLQKGQERYKQQTSINKEERDF